ncbi:PAC1 [Symbiodinium necroappetens]|uniref:PAC1 protein n=1 Tax=Symbiodinium necroappetens TaxID=1628268 RepID=A0A812QV60_9DINO|nr:PAC1 [Symbiodinium necroappetens]
MAPKGEAGDSPDLEARAILDEAEKLLTLGKLEESSEQALVAREYFLETGDLASEAEAFRIEILAKQDEGEYGARTGEVVLKASEIDLLCEIELSRAKAAGDIKAEAVLLYTLVEVNVTRSTHKMRTESKEWCDESIRLFEQLGATFWQARAVLMMVNVQHKFQDSDNMQKYAKQAHELFGRVGDRKRQGMALHASSLAYLGEKNTPAAIDCGLQALAIYRDIGDRRLEIAELKTIAVWRMGLEGNQGKIAAREALEALELSRKYTEPNQEILRPIETVTLHVALQALLQIGERKEALRAAQISLKRFQKDPRLQMETATLQVLVDELQGKKTQNEMELMQGIKSRKQRMHILIDLARSHCNNGQMDEAEAAVAEGLELAREFGKTLREAQGLRILAQLQLARGNHYQAMSSVKKSRKLSTQDEDKEGEASAWLLQAECHAAARSFDEAQVCCREAHAICEEHDLYKKEIEVWHRVVELHMATSHPDAALQAAAKRVEVVQRNNGSVKEQVEALDMLCSLMLVQKNVPEAEKAAAEMLRLAKLNESLVDLELAALSQLVQVNIVRLSETPGQGSFAGKALQYAEQGWSLACRDAASIEYKSAAKYWQAEALICVGRHQQALTAAYEAEALFNQTKRSKDHGGMLRCLLLQGRLAKALGRLDEAIQCAERAIQNAVETGNSSGEKMAREEMQRIRQPDEDYADYEPEPAYETRASRPEDAGNVVRSHGIDRELVKQKLSTHVQNVLTEEQHVDAESPLMDLGLDSLSAIDLQNLIASSFPFMVDTATVLFDYPTLRELTEHIVEQSQLAGV